MHPIHVIPKSVAHYILCIDDSLPDFETESWIILGNTYRLMGVAESINLGDEASFIIADPTNNKIIRPSSSYRGFRGSRFENKMIIHLN